MDNDPALHELTIDRFHGALRSGDITAVQLVDWYLDRIAKHNSSGAQIQAVVTVNPRARDDAAALDEYLATAGRLSGALHGVPVLVKDQVETAGLRTTFGSILFEDYVPQRDATLVTNLKDSGAVILAKTSLCDFAAGWFSSSSMTDHTKNPYSLEREAGGSSAGTAAGVAANFGLTGIGEDTGGSIRIPASFNNLFGLRVTTGLISRTGLSPLVHYQDTPGPIGRTVADVARTLDGIVGYDPEDVFTFPPAHVSGDGYARSLDAGVPLNRWRVGVLESGFGSDLNPDMEPVNGLVRTAVRRLDGLGVSVTPGLQIPDLDRWISDTAGYVQQSKSDITGFLAGRPGAPVASFMELYDSRRFHPLNDLFHGIAGGPEEIDQAEYRRIRRSQEDLQALIVGMLADQEVDFLVYPTVQVIPPTRDELAAAKYECLTFPTNTVIAAQAGLPALTIPVGFTDDGLPVGMELLGAPFSESRLLQFAHAWEKSTALRRAPTL